MIIMILIGYIIYKFIKFNHNLPHTFDLLSMDIKASEFTKYKHHTFVIQEGKKYLLSPVEYAHWKQHKIIPPTCTKYILIK